MRLDRRMLARLVLACATACSKSAVPARIVAGSSDTVVVNNMRPVRLPTRVQDAKGNALPDSAVRYFWVSGDTVAISASGVVTCPERRDATVRAALGRLTTLITVRCRPVANVRFPGSLEIVVGDTAQAIPFTAYGPDNRLVELLAAKVWVRDSDVVALDGNRVQGRKWGTTLLSITVGDHGATTGVRVYAPATTLEGLSRERKLVAVPVRLTSGEMKRWALPPGGWILSMLAPQDDELGLKLRVEGATCEVLTGFGPRRYGCMSNQTASVIVYAPWRPGSKRLLTGVLGVKPDAESIHTTGSTHDSANPLPSSVPAAR